ncbi:MAG: DNA internalization-related competence protein ComEC/Rec2 [Armatimonadetes bacterium]|nr:DNA internalization-related competence protein ComEC/Rec2 [Armatimonadota bacterium]
MHRPIIWIAAAFAAGIMLGKATTVGLYGWMLAGALCAAAAALLHVRRHSASIAIVAAVAAAGGLWYQINTLPPGAGSAAASAGHEVTLTGTVVRPPASSRDRLRFVVRAEQLIVRSQSRRATGLILVSTRARAPLHYGDIITLRGRLVRPPPAGNPGEFSYRDYLAAQGIHAQLVSRPGADLRISGRRRLNPIVAAAHATRVRMAAFFRRAMPGTPGALLTSLLLGDDGAVPDEVRETFRSAGLLHVLVVSGAQVGLVAGTMLWLARAVGLAHPAGAAGAAGAVAFFALMAGWAPSVARATIMALTGLVAVLIGRDRDLYAALAAAAVALLVTSPLLLFDAGFQLSFAATWSLIYVAPALADRMTRLPYVVRTLVAMTVAAQLTVMPILAVHFAQVSLAGFVANLVVVPLVGVLVPAGFLCGIIGAAAAPVGMILASLLAPLVGAVALAAAWFARLPAATLGVTPPSFVTVGVCYVVLVVVVESLRGRVRLRPALLRIAVPGAVAMLVWIQVASALAPARLVMTFLDVGQGDAIVIRAPSGRVMMIDGGGEIEGRETGYDIGLRRVIPALRRMRIHQIDVLVLSHPHEDHAGGLVAVAENFRVGVMLDSGYPHPAPSYPRLLRIIDARGIPYRLARRGMRLDLGGGVQVLVLHPEEPLISGSSADVNLNSIVLRVTYGRVSALFTGDIEGLVETGLLARGDELRSTMLKVAHHGSRTSSRPEFLEAVAPQLALISVGAWNPFGHPHPITLDALAAAGARIYRTDRHGAITVESDGQSVWVHTTRDAGDH